MVQSPLMRNTLNPRSLTGNSCPLTQLIFVLSSQGLFLSSLLIFLSADLCWPRACTWGMLEEWRAVLWERIFANSVCLQYPQPGSYDLNSLSKTGRVRKVCWPGSRFGVCLLTRASLSPGNKLTHPQGKILMEYFLPAKTARPCVSFSSWKLTLVPMWPSSYLQDSWEA